MLTQLNPPIPLRHENGRKLVALAVIDYGPDYDLLWVCGYEDNGEIWTYSNKHVRLVPNETLGRHL